MSFILDAIKKSEDGRQRSKAPDVFSLQNSGAINSAPQSKWVKFILLMIALVMLAAIFSWLWPQLQSQFINFKPYGESGKDEIAVAGVPSSQRAQAGVDKSNALPPAESSIPAANAQQAGRQYSSDGVLPPRHLIKELWEMPADYQSTVPDLKFSFHVYSKNPDKRTIIINGRRMREGQMVTSQLKLRLITETGVICHQNGQFFHVDVVEKW